MISTIDALKAEVIRLVASGACTVEEACEALSEIEDKSTAPPDENHICKFYCYVRVSSKDQAENGMSLESQQRQARAYFAYLKTRPEHRLLEWGAVFIEGGKSAFKFDILKRPQGLAMQNRLRRGDHVCFFRLDRAFRNTKDFLTMHGRWERQGVRIHFLDLNMDLGTANGRLFATFMAAMAQWDSDRKSEHSKLLHARLEEENRAQNGETRYGTKLVRTKNNRRYVPDSEQHAYFRLLLHCHDYLGLNFQQCADRLEKIRCSAKRDNIKFRPEDFNRFWNRQRCRKVYEQLVAGKIKGMERFAKQKEMA